ncbi:hypothetical protein MMC24_002370 [Lignoscripta atroalba]|nr:hypothetical protein [Lignoscripta atroalba]
MTNLNLPLQPELLSWGEVGIVYKVTKNIVLKRPIEDDNPHIRNECSVFDLLETHPPCPNLIQSFFRLPTANFLQFIGGGTLEERLRARQTKDPSTGQVLKVEATEPQHLIIRWMTELSNAAAWLESLGYAHGDIRPPNILLDYKGHLKLIDFDNTTTVGTALEVGVAPYARVLGDESGEDRGTFGNLGPRTEQFATGSNFYYMTRGYEPYDNEWFGKRHGPRTVDLLQSMAFPGTDDSTIDTIIRCCWHGKFDSIQRLSVKVRLLLLDRVEDSSPKVITGEELKSRQDECRQLVADGLLDSVGRHGKA